MKPEDMDFAVASELRVGAADDVAGMPARQAKDTSPTRISAIVSFARRELSFFC
jgi:hypothetical protein